jgi:hypothetical protein
MNVAVVPMVVSLAACGILEPGEGRWRSLGLDGKWITAVAGTPWGLFAGTRDDGVFHLVDVSGQWNPLGLEHLYVYSMLVIRATPPRLLVGVGIRTPWDPREASVFATGDGATWTPADGGLASDGGGPGVSLAVDPGRPERLFLGDGFNVLRSEDAGETWSYVRGSKGLAGQGVSVLVSPAGDGTVWAAVIGAFGTSSVDRSRDWGDNWESFAPFPGVEQAIYGLAVDPRNTSKLWAGLDAGAIASEDAGETWQASLVADYTSIPALIWLGEDLIAIGMYRNFDTNEAGDPIGDEINRLRLYRLPGGAGQWERIDVPSDVRGGRSATIDSRGRLVVGTAGSGVWLWER